MSDWTAYGRVDADGTVYVKTADGDRVVGSWQAGTPEEGLAHFARRFADLVTEVDLVEARLKSGAADAPREYRAAWFRFDNATGTVQPIGETRGTGTRLPSPPNLPSSAGTFVAVDLTADGAPYPSWSLPARAYFRRTVDGWKLVGLDRMGAQRRS